jgi:hypothetical protein
MSKESLKLTGRVVSINANNQSFLIESKQSPARFRVYADDALFRALNRTLDRSRFYGGKAKEIIGTFLIQGRILVQFCIGSDLHELTNVLCAAFKEFRAKKKDFLAIGTNRC